MTAPARPTQRHLGNLRDLYDTDEDGEVAEIEGRAPPGAVLGFEEDGPNWMRMVPFDEAARVRDAVREEIARVVPSPWMSPERAAAYLDLPSVEALYMQVSRGNIPCRRMGKRLLFNGEEIDRWLTRPSKRVTRSPTLPLKSCVPSPTESE